MRRLTTFCTAAAIGVSTIAVSTAALARPMPAPAAGYYVIRWDNTGVCQIWNTELKEQPVRFMSDYKVVSKPVPTFAAAVSVQEKLRAEHRCSL